MIPLEGRMAVIEVAKRFPEESERLWDHIGRGEISVAEYLSEWKKLFVRMAKVMLFSDVRRQLENKI